MNENDPESQKFEESIIKLVGFAKNKVKYDEFTSTDK